MASHGIRRDFTLRSWRAFVSPTGLSRRWGLVQTTRHTRCIATEGLAPILRKAGVQPGTAVGWQNPERVPIGDAYAMLDGLWLFLTAVQAAMRPRQDLVLENLLLRHQLAVLTRPTRLRPHARLHLWDKLLWILARRFCAGWGEHLSLVTPETVVRWHRQG
jgi:hypothetical protein